MRLAGLDSVFHAEARPEHQGDRLYDIAGNLLWDRDGLGHDRPEIDRSALRRILLDSLDPAVVRWGSKVDAIVPGEAVQHIVVDGREEPFKVVVGADGTWSRVRPHLSPAVPAYEGVAAIELGFDAAKHTEVAALVGAGKTSAAGNDHTLIGQLNGHGHIRGGYGAWRMDEDAARSLAAATSQEARARALAVFADFAPVLLRLIQTGDLLGVRAIHALPIGHRWPGRAGLTLLGDAAHAMSPFSGEGANLALGDAADLAQALASGEGWSAVTAYETGMAERAVIAAAGARAGLEIATSPKGVSGILRHYRQREAA